MKITSSLLRSKGACADQLRLFDLLFPDGVEITEAVCLSVANRFDWDWAAVNLLSRTAVDAYLAAKAPALDVYLVATATAKSAKSAYNAAKATAFARASQHHEGGRPTPDV